MAWPWEKPFHSDPHERPLPVPMSERAKVLLMAAVLAGCGLLLRVRAGDGRHEGAALALAAGLAASILGLLQLVWLRSSTDADRIFLPTKRAAGFVYAAVVVAGAATSIVALGSGA